MVMIDTLNKEKLDIAGVQETRKEKLVQNW